MTNWCEGSLRIRGPKKNIQAFLLNGLEPHESMLEKLKTNKYYSHGFLEPCEDEKKIELKDGDILFFSSCHIKDTERGRVSYVEAYLSEYEDDEVFSIALNAKFAGLIKAKELLSICQKYDIDMRIYGFERGAQVNQDIEIINNEITKNELTKYDDYIWDCILPELGG